MASPTSPYKYFLVSTPIPYVTHVQINRPSKLNSFYEPMWLELKTVIDTLSLSPDVRAIILSGAGDRAFTTGLDVQAASEAGILKQVAGDTARKAVGIKRHVEEFQNCVGSVEKCEKPVICVLHGFSFGLALDLSTCADIRLCTSDVKLAEKAIAAALEIAGLLASKSPVAVQGTKELLNHARDHTVADSLRYTGVWNSAAIQTSDVERAMLSGLKKTKPTFEKL
ncbi:enoyl-CoA hydratase/isomerase family protein [Diplocarpon rosae]|nr:enoyl-CoA hydratase/isomerase family protein [Diplocarpon rosae]